ncbi:MAG TPA: YraN family protein [Candidatus Protoclostridium stercorigallinarum]|uniref:UPF0102 protein H9892_06980 n=1 Tax=Candidatus Protoclostridium stercorigallinarum TaxID=2838741 RepID=A0A9D1TSA9_9FIRM|nr:YraN family protein [Candidatus Protoclostridium stercorigallinarum]
MSKHENKTSGSRGEKLAEKYLRDNGYRILARNFTTDIGEIDLIATDDEFLIFVEVKARMSDAYGEPAEAVDVRKQRKLSMVASQYIKKSMLFGAPARFDVIEVRLDTGKISHIENAFDSYLRY